VELLRRREFVVSVSQHWRLQQHFMCLVVVAVVVVAAAAAVVAVVSRWFTDYGSRGVAATL